MRHAAASISNKYIAVRGLRATTARYVFDVMPFTPTRQILFIFIAAASVFGHILIKKLLRTHMSFC